MRLQFFTHLTEDIQTLVVTCT